MHTEEYHRITSVQAALAVSNVAHNAEHRTAILVGRGFSHDTKTSARSAFLSRRISREPLDRALFRLDL
jgi:hypothetical protein